MQRFREILVVATPDPDMPTVIARATELAARNRARLTLFDVVPELPAKQAQIERGTTTVDLQRLLVESRRRELLDMLSRVMTVEARVDVAVGVEFVEIIKRVIEYGHDLVITVPDRAADAPGLRGATTTLHLLRKCPVPVWVDDPRTWGRKDVVVAVGPFDEDGDAGQLDQTLIQLGTSLARIQHGVAHVVHAWQLEGENLLRGGRLRLSSDEVDALIDEERIATEKAFGRLMDGLGALDVEVVPHLRKGRSSDVIAQVVEETQPAVLVMGTLARTGIRGRLIGNTAERLFSELEASVMAVKPPGFVSPLA